MIIYICSIIFHLKNPWGKWSEGKLSSRCLSESQKHKRLGPFKGLGLIAANASAAFSLPEQDFPRQADQDQIKNMLGLLQAPA